MLQDGGDHVLLERVAVGTFLEGLIQNCEFLARLGQCLHEAFS